MMDEKKQLILQHAKDLFLTQGFQVISMDDIAKACGMGKASIYHYYESKDALFHAMLDNELDQYETGITTELKKVKSASDRLLHFVELKFATIKRHHQDLKNPNEFFTAIGAKYFEIMHRFGQKDSEMIASILFYGITTGEFKQVDPIKLSSIIVSLFWGMQYSVYGKHCVDGFTIPSIENSENQTKYLIENLLTGITTLQSQESTK